MKRLSALLMLVGFVGWFFQATHIQTSGTLPANCTIGDIYIKTGSGLGFYTCNATNTWTGPITGAGSGDVVGPAGSITDEALTRFDGTTGELLQGSLITLNDTGVLTFPDGVKQTFNPDGTNAGLNVGSQAGDPSSLANGDIWYNSSAAKFKCRENGTTSDCIGAGGTLGDLLDFQIIRKTGDESVTSSAALQSDDHLVFPIGASETWMIEYFLSYDGVLNANGDIKVAVNVPSGATGLTFGSNLAVAAASGTGDFTTFTSTDLTDTGVASWGTGGTTFRQFLRWTVYVINSTNAGNVTLRWAQNTSNGTATTIYTGSIVRGFRVN